MLQTQRAQLIMTTMESPANGSKRRMKVAILIILGACITQGAAANDGVILQQLKDQVDAMRTRNEAAENPELLNRDWDKVERSGSLERLKYIDRMRALQAAARAKAASQARIEAEYSRKLAEAEARAAAARDQIVAAARAQAQARLQAARNEGFQAARNASEGKPPPATSDLMKRMGFSEGEVAAQKTVEGQGQSDAGKVSVTAQMQLYQLPPNPFATDERLSNGRTNSQAKPNKPSIPPPAPTGATGKKAQTEAL